MWGQIPWVLLSVASFVLVWLPKRGTGRIRAMAGQSGIVIFLVAWLWLPFTAQPRIVGILQFVLVVLGFSFFVFGISLCVRAYRTIRSVIGWGHDKPSRLVKEGVYGRMRHPIYSGLMIGLLGWALIWGTVYAILLTPFLYLLLKLESSMEEKLTLEKKFGEAYLAYREKVPAFFSFMLAALLLIVAALIGSGIILGWIPLIAGGIG